MSAWFAVACIVVALVAAAFFAGAETALTAASRARLRALQTAGDERAPDQRLLLVAAAQFENS